MLNDNRSDVSTEPEVPTRIDELTFDMWFEILSLLELDDLFSMLYVSLRLCRITSSDIIQQKIWTKRWGTFLGTDYPSYSITEEDEKTPLKQYQNYRSLPMYAKQNMNDVLLEE